MRNLNFIVIYDCFLIAIFILIMTGCQQPKFEKVAQHQIHALDGGHSSQFQNIILDSLKVSFSPKGNAIIWYMLEGGGVYKLSNLNASQADLTLSILKTPGMKVDTARNELTINLH